MKTTIRKLILITFVTGSCDTLSVQSCKNSDGKYIILKNSQIVHTS